MLLKVLAKDKVLMKLGLSFYSIVSGSTSLLCDVVLSRKIVTILPDAKNPRHITVEFEPILGGGLAAC